MPSPFLSVRAWLPNVYARLVKGSDSTVNSPVDDAPLPFPPLPPRELLANRHLYEDTLRRRGRFHTVPDTPLRSLYRIYEHIVLDHPLAYRNEFEFFWGYGTEWLVRDIPDPEDPDTERQTILAIITRLLCISFNYRINELGLPRDAPPIFSGDDLERWRAQERAQEEPPEWASKVTPLKDRLVLPHWTIDDDHLVDPDPAKASDVFEEYNILSCKPEIIFV